MMVLALQIFMIDTMVKIDIKVTGGDGYDVYLEKLIDSEKEFEQIKREIARKLDMFDGVVRSKLKKDEPALPAPEAVKISEPATWFTRMVSRFNEWRKKLCTRSR